MCICLSLQNVEFTCYHKYGWDCGSSSHSYAFHNANGWMVKALHFTSCTWDHAQKITKLHRLDYQNLNSAKILKFQKKNIQMYEPTSRQSRWWWTNKKLRNILDFPTECAHDGKPDKSNCIENVSLDFNNDLSNEYAQNHSMDKKVIQQLCVHE